MLITMRNDLPEEQKENIQKLHALCTASDGTTTPLALDNAMNFDAGLPSYYLGTEDGDIVAFLMIFAPNSDEAEITAFTAPAHRRQGRFRALLAEAEAQLRTRGVRRILMLCDSASADGRAALNKLNAQYEYGEYSMSRLLSRLPCADSGLEITEAGPEELEELYEHPPAIYTLGIRPDLRGRGLGKALLLLILKEIASHGHISAALDVNNGNTAALSLYRKVGFAVKAQVDYYRLLSLT